MVENWDVFLLIWLIYHIKNIQKLYLFFSEGGGKQAAKNIVGWWLNMHPLAGVPTI